MAGRLETIRRQRGLSRPAVASQLGVSEKTIYRMERGQTALKRVHLLALARVYDIPPEELEEQLEEELAA
jgi:transcriptional regulator with XRE-family HTH domain